jgi:hypothetical protein
MHTRLACPGLETFTDAKTGNGDEFVVAVNKGNTCPFPLGYAPLLEQFLKRAVMSITGASRLLSRG